MDLMKSILAVGFIFLFSSAFSQSIIEWAPDVRLGLEDFQSSQTEINKELGSYSLYSGTNMDFLFQMSGYEFAFTKNFNSKVKTIFHRNSAVIIAPDSLIASELVNFAQYSFDLTELYSRKFRQRMYEEKGAFSNFGFFKPIFDEHQIEMNAESAKVMKATDIGRKSEMLEQEHQKVLQQIQELSDFCMECKPPKKKKRKKN